MNGLIVARLVVAIHINCAFAPSGQTMKVIVVYYVCLSVCLMTLFRWLCFCIFAASSRQAGARIQIVGHCTLSHNS